MSAPEVVEGTVVGWLPLVLTHGVWEDEARGMSDQDAAQALADSIGADGSRVRLAAVVLPREDDEDEDGTDA